MVHRSRGLRWIVLATGLVAVVAIAACDVVMPETPDLHVDNGTTLDVEVFVGERLIDTVGPSTVVTWSPPTVPPLPWRVSVRTGSGRELVAFVVGPGDGGSTTGPDGLVDTHGAGARVDLSCGRLDAYAGPPLIGPAPRPAVPGDCEP